MYQAIFMKHTVNAYGAEIDKGKWVEVHCEPLSIYSSL